MMTALSPFSRLLLRIGSLGLDRCTLPELLDGNDFEEIELAANLRDIERVNRWLGGVSLTRRSLMEIVKETEGKRTVHVLDVGTGSGDIPAKLLETVPVPRLDMNATDRNPRMVELARFRLGGQARVDQAEAAHLPFPDKSFDVATCSLLLHHLPTEEVMDALKELSRVSRLGIVVNDLVRNSPAHAASLILARYASRNRLSKHDGPLSVRRSYTLREMLSLIEDAGLTIRSVRQWGMYRVAVTAS